MSVRSSGVLACLLLFGAAPAWAVITPGTLSPSSNDGAISVNSFNFVPPVIQHYGAPVVDSQSVTSTSATGTATTTGGLTIINSPTPGIFTSASIDLTGVAGGQVSVQGLSHYSFQILGAPGEAQVAVNAIGNVGFSSDARAGTAFAFLRVQQQFNGPIIIDDTLSLSSNGVGFIDQNDPTHYAPNPFLSFIVAGNYMFLTNTVYDVTLQAQIGGILNNNAGHFLETMFANVDPTFAVNGAYTIEVSPGFGGVTVNSPGGGDVGGVPEPATWAMMLLGFAGVGYGARRARRRRIGSPRPT